MEKLAKLKSLCILPEVERLGRAGRAPSRRNELPQSLG